jgi:maltooligosyltrehalose trehalohydrolase
MRGGYCDAQWNDDAHHVLHVLLTGETSGYYAAYAENTVEKLARRLKDSSIRGADPHRRGEPRGTPSVDLPPSAFVMFLKNHDQIVNRPLGSG